MCVSVNLDNIFNEITFDPDILPVGRGVDPYGTGGHVPLIFMNGGHP